MIKTKNDLKTFMDRDRLMNGIKKKGLLYDIYLHAVKTNIKFLYYLRKEEYYINCKVPGGRLILLYYKYRKKKLGVKLGFSIPANVFGPGLSLPHYGTIVVSKYARIGANCRLHVCTNIGASAGLNSAPNIADNVYIGPGAILFGDIKIAENITIAANSTVNKSCLVPNVVLAGSPAKIVKENYKNWLEFNNISEA